MFRVRHNDNETPNYDLKRNQRYNNKRTPILRRPRDREYVDETPKMYGKNMGGRNRTPSRLKSNWNRMNNVNETPKISQPYFSNK